jgi:hypothetical protein
MPLIKTLGPYEFRFYSRENHEPPHIHVISGRHRAKFWLEPRVRQAGGSRFRTHELNEIERLVIAHREEFLYAWRAYFE